MGDLRSRDTLATVSYSGSGMSGKVVWVKEVEQRVESQLERPRRLPTRQPCGGLRLQGHKAALWLGGP